MLFFKFYILQSLIRRLALMLLSMPAGLLLKFRLNIRCYKRHEVVFTKN